MCLLVAIYKDGNLKFMTINMMTICRSSCWVLLVLLLACVPGMNIYAALGPGEVLVIANSRAADSVSLARFYLEKRKVPAENLLKLRVNWKETCSREEYDDHIARPVKKYLEKRQQEGKLEPIRCLLLVYGMPLKVAPTKMTAGEKRQQKKLRQLKDACRKRMKDLDKKDKVYREAASQLKKTGKQLKSLSHAMELASVDSELSLVMAGNYPLPGWLPNPSFLGYRGKKIKNEPRIAYMVARLDGSNPKIVKRMITDSITAEKNGLSGTAYFDARWPMPKPEKGKKLSGYAFYDNSIHLAAEQAKRSGRMPVVVNDKGELFQPGDCPDAVLYCGWYKLAHYVPAFTWRPGAVGFHIASSECGTLHNKNSQVWCKRMLEEGVAATIGPVAEPYVQSFPVPALFFGLLLDGRFSLAECFVLSTPFRSWRQVLVGDPLYRPFKRKVQGVK